MALDFAVTSGLRNVPAAMQDASSCLTFYEDFQHNHLDTERLCNEDGFNFMPMVCEALGGAWSPSAVKILNKLAKSKSLLTGEPVALLRKQLYQKLGVILHRENARATLRRCAALQANNINTHLSLAATIAEDAANRARI